MMMMKASERRVMTICKCEQCFDLINIIVMLAIITK
jgi:hypothetical protein